jgi:hypothetical protein
MGMVLAHALAQLQRLLGGGGDIGMPFS